MSSDSDLLLVGIVLKFHQRSVQRRHLVDSMLRRKSVAGVVSPPAGPTQTRSIPNVYEPKVRGLAGMHMWGLVRESVCRTFLPTTTHQMQNPKRMTSARRTAISCDFCVWLRVCRLTIYRGYASGG
jgi:hypothetical protein